MSVRQLIKNIEPFIRKHKKVILILFTVILIVILIYLKRLKRDGFSPYLSNPNDSKIQKMTYFKMLREFFNENFPIMDDFKKMEDEERIFDLEDFLVKSVNNVVKKENGISNIDRGIYDVMIRDIYSDVEYIFGVLLTIANTKLGVGDRYFLKVYIKENKETGDLRIVSINQDFEKDVKFISYNYDRDDIEKIEIIESEAKGVINKNLDIIDSVLRDNGVIPDYKKNFIKLSYAIKFSINNKVRDIILEKIKDKFKEDVRLKDEILFSQRDLYDIYYNNTLYNREYIVGMDIFLQKMALNVRLIVYFVIKNIDKYIDSNTENFFENAEQFMTEDDIEVMAININTMKLYEDIDLSFVPSEEASVSDYYTITNKLHLLGQFEKDGKDLKITEEMLNDHSRNLNKLTKYKVDITDITKMGYCYDTDRTSGMAKYTDREECVNNGGVWDFPPIDNNECPFYKSNTNYGNMLGKIMGNACQLPMNMRLIGHRYYSESDNFMPLCYNCKEGDNLINSGTLGYCCEKQKNRDLYPNLSSPDYAFDGDSSFREVAKDELNGKNLSVI